VIFISIWIDFTYQLKTIQRTNVWVGWQS